MGFIPSGQRNTHPTIRGCHPTSDLRTTRLDVAALEHAVEHYFHSGIAPSTSRVYAVGANRHLALCDQLNTQPLPTSEQLLCKFAAHLATLNIAYSSISRYTLQLLDSCMSEVVCLPHGRTTWLNYSKCYGVLRSRKEN